MGDANVSAAVVSQIVELRIGHMPIEDIAARFDLAPAQVRTILSTRGAKKRRKWNGRPDPRAPTGTRAKVAGKDVGYRDSEVQQRIARLVARENARYGQVTVRFVEPWSLKELA